MANIRNADDEWSVKSSPFQEEIARDFRGYFYLLEGAVGV